MNSATAAGTQPRPSPPLAISPAYLAGRFGAQRLLQPPQPPRRLLRQHLRRFSPAPLRPGRQRRRQRRIQAAAGTFGDDQVRQSAQFLPAMPLRQADETVGAEQPGNRPCRPTLVAQLLQGVVGVGRTVQALRPLQFAQVQAQAGFAGDGQGDHVCPLCGVGARRRAVRRVGGGNQRHRHLERIARGAGNGQVAVVDRIEGAAVAQHQALLGVRGVHRRRALSQPRAGARRAPRPPPAAGAPARPRHRRRRAPWRCGRLSTPRRRSVPSAAVRHAGSVHA